MQVKRLYYFIDRFGIEKTISEQEYLQKCKEYEKLCWDYDDFSRNFINNKDYVQYENCITFYLNDFQVTLGYGQKEIY